MDRGDWWLQSLTPFTPTGLTMSHFSFTTFSLDESLFSVFFHKANNGYGLLDIVDSM